MTRCHDVAVPRRCRGPVPCRAQCYLVCRSHLRPAASSIFAVNVPGEAQLRPVTHCRVHDGQGEFGIAPAPAGRPESVAVVSPAEM
jgi:hypothetical protein